MQKEAIFQLFSDKVSFQGIASRNFLQGEFCGLFTIKGVPFMIDHIFYSGNKQKMWDVSKSKIVHYTFINEEDVEANHTCPFCGKPYREIENKREVSLCDHINEEPYISAIWGSCVYSESFKNTFEELTSQLNPKGIGLTTI